MGLKSNFMWGGATASYQCEGAWNEGGRIESEWDRYLHENNFESGDTASDFYHHYSEDIEMMAEGGQNAFRFSFAWPRIMDEKGNRNQEGINFYHNVIHECRIRGIEPFVTLYHWDLPEYLAKEGGWTNRETCDAFEKYAELCFREFGSEIKWWTTFNEPKWTIVSGYLVGNYPPAEKNAQHAAEAGYHMMLAHAMAVKKFREMNVSGSIGIVHSYAPVDGVNDSESTQKAMRFADNFMNNWVLDVAAKGAFPEDFLEALTAKEIDLSFMKEEDVQLIAKQRVDFLGLNYYARALVKPYSSGETTLTVNNSGSKGKGTTVTLIKNWFEQVRDPESKYTEWDTEIYPQGLYSGLIRANERYHLPIFITENGIGMYEDVSNGEVNDQYRISFMNDHINAMMNASDEGVDVCGYFAWSSFDLYSWKNGCEKRYGLVGVDFKDPNLKRIPKKSFYWFKGIAESNGAKIERRKQ